MTWARRVIAALIVGFFLFYLISQPEAAAAAVRTVFDAVAFAFRSIVQFFSALASLIRRRPPQVEVTASRIKSATSSGRSR